jgi:hypothetical protein
LTPPTGLGMLPRSGGSSHARRHRMMARGSGPTRAARSCSPSRPLSLWSRSRAESVISALLRKSLRALVHNIHNFLRYTGTALMRYLCSADTQWIVLIAYPGASPFSGLDAPKRLNRTVSSTSNWQVQQLARIMTGPMTSAISPCRYLGVRSAREFRLRLECRKPGVPGMVHLVIAAFD